MRASKKTRALLAAAAAAAIVAPMTMSAGTATAATPKRGLHIGYNLSVGDYVGPLQFAKSGTKTYVADSFTSHLWQIGVKAPLATGPNPKKGGDIAGVAVNPTNGDVAYTTTDFVHHIARLIVLHDGVASRIAYIGSYEYRHNPDGPITYGLQDPARYPCVRDTLIANHIPVQYHGEIDSHPYAVTYIGGGSWAVADAGGNDILRVGPLGGVSLIRTIGAQPLLITAAFAHANHLDSCAIGHTYFTESVPTDVEIGPNQNLYVSTLPGGPEDPTAGARGRIYTINPTTRAWQLIGSGFVNPTNLAVTAGGIVYVAEPFANRVSALSNGRPSPRMTFVGVAAVEMANGHLFAATAPSLVGSSNPARVSELTF